MKKLSFGHAALLGLVAGAMLLVAGCSKKPSAAAGDDMSMGDPKAKITIVEYASVACPICGRVNDTIMPEFKKRYVDTGKVHYVYRPMMTGNQAVATAGHLLAACAGKDKYFSVIDAVMRSQQEMDAGGPPEQYTNARPVLLNIAKSVNMSDADFNKCITDPKGIDHLNDLNQQYLTKDGIEGTPTFFVNGKKISGIPNDIGFFEDAIKSAPAAK